MTNPVLMTICAIAGLLFVFFILKKLFKWALILILLGLIVLFFYEGFTTPGGFKEKMKGAYEKTKVQGEEVLKQGKEKVVTKGKQLTHGAGRTLTEKKKLYEKSKTTDE
jgi:energy-coupling factor transporter transmembrane protein EcfT